MAASAGWADERAGHRPKIPILPPRKNLFPLRGPGLATALVATLSAPFGFPATPPVRRGAEEDVNNAAVRERAGLVPRSTLLFNGWGVTPAGRHVRALAPTMIVSPAKTMLVASSGGFSDTGLTLLDLKTPQVSQFLPLKKCWNGVVFRRDGRRIFVAGGDSGRVHVSDCADGKATPKSAADPVPRPQSATADRPKATPVFVAGLAVHPTLGTLDVCNEARHEVWVLHADTLAREATTATGHHPARASSGPARNTSLGRTGAAARST